MAARPTEAERVTIVGAQHDMVHVPHEPGEGHHRHVAEEEDDEGAHDEEMERPADLAVAGQCRILRESIGQGR
jgi:hypothetical protein